MSLCTTHAVRFILIGATLLGYLDLDVNEFSCVVILEIQVVVMLSGLDNIFASLVSKLTSFFVFASHTSSSWIHVMREKFVCCGSSTCCMRIGLGVGSISEYRIMKVYASNAPILLASFVCITLFPSFLLEFVRHVCTAF